MSQWSRYITAEFPREAISTIDQNILHGQCLDMPRPGTAYACFQSYIHTVFDAYNMQNWPGLF